jgi:DNA-binding NtrC family response regulator
LLDLPPILIVDAQPEVRTEIMQSLSRVGFPVEFASDGLEALNRFKALKYSMVITDDQAPGIGGMEILNSIKKISPQIPVVIMTANGTVHNAVAAMQAGACDYILKPFSPEVLQRTVKKVVSSSAGNGTDRSGDESNDHYSDGKEIITRNAELMAILKQARNIAPSKATVLIQGESGTGKELLAAYIHRHGLQPDAPYVALNCAALPDTLAESELFGHEKGSFTGAVGRKIGKFELAQGGTVVLDEIGEMPLPLQAKLLRVLQEKEIDRIGGKRPIPIDARVIAISNTDLKKAITGGKFREDLFYRINVIPLTLPPLRQRKDDIVLLADHFIEKYSRLNRKDVAGLSEAAVEVLFRYPWRGNVRELENTIERAVLISSGEQILAENLLMEAVETGNESPPASAMRAGITVRNMEKELIFRTLEEVDDNRTHAAELLGISIRTLRNKLREYREETDAQGA